MAATDDGGVACDRRTSAALVHWMRSAINGATAGPRAREARQASKAELRAALQAIDPAFNQLWLKRALGHRADRRPAPVPIEVVEAIGAIDGADLEQGLRLWHEAGRGFAHRGGAVAPPRMRGRSAETHVAMSLVDSVRTSGHSATLVVIAEAGFGKTTFIDSLAAQEATRGASLLRVEAGLPGLAALEEVLDIEPLATTRRTSLAPAEIDALIHHREATIEEALYTTAKHGVTLMLVDDLHDADDAVRGLLARFVRRRLPVPLLTIVASRPLPDAGSVLGGIRATPGTVAIELGALDEPAVAEMVDDRAAGLSRHRRTEIARQVVRVTGGDPAGTALVLDGAFDGTTWRPGHSVDTIGSDAPRRTLDRWSERLALLPPDARTTVEAAAVAGRHSDVRLLRQVPHLDGLHERVAAAVATAVDAGILSWQDELDFVATFVHDQARDAALGGLPHPVRLELHHQIADALEGPLGRVVEPDEYLRASTVVDHRLACMDAYPGDPAVSASVLSYAPQALARADVASAVEALRLALDQPVLTRSPADQHRRARLLQIYASGPVSWSDRERALLEAIDLVHDGDPVDVELAADLACDLSHLSLYGQPGPTITKVLNRSARQLGDEQPARRARVTARLASHLVWSSGTGPDLAVSDTLSRDAELLARSSEDPEAIAVALEARAVVLAALPDAGALLDTAQALRTVGPPSWIEFIAHIRRADRQALDRTTAEFEGADSLPLWYRQAYCHQLRCLLAFTAGELAVALAEAGAVTDGYEGGDADFEHSQGAALIWERHLAGDGPAARAIVEVAVEQFPEVDSYRAALALFELDPGGDPARARAVANELVERGLDAWRHPHSRLPGLAFLAEVIAALELPELAAPVREALLPFAGQLVVLGPGTLCLGATDRFIAMLTPAVNRDLDGARQGFEAALALEDAFDAPGLAATTLYWHGRTVAEHGDRAEARELFADAAVQVPAPMAGLAAAIEKQQRGLRRRAPVTSEGAAGETGEP